MKWEKLYSPTYTLLKVELESGESITSEAGAFVYGKGNYDIKTQTLGVGAAILRALFARESLFLNTFTAKEKSELAFAPVFPGDIQAISLNNSELIVQDSSYLAHSGNISVGIGFRGIKGFVANPYSGFFWLKLTGSGIAFVNGFGAIEVIELGPGEKMTIDNNHFVAMDSRIKWDIKTFGGAKSFLFGGEFWVMEVEGPGYIWIQTRSVAEFIKVLASLLPRRR